MGRRRALVDGSEVLLDHVAVGLEPVCGLLKLAALDGPDLHPAAALVVFRRDVEGRHYPTEREVLDLLHTLLDVFARGLGAALGLDGVANGFEMDGGLEHAAIVYYRVFLLLGFG